MEKALDKKNTKKPLLLFLMLAIVLSLTGVVLARFIMKKSQTAMIEAENFYFTSDYLKESKAEYTIDAGNAPFKIEVFNYEDSQRITQSSIEFNVAVTNGSVVTTNQTLAGNTQSSQEIEIKPNNGAKEVTVTVTSKKPYQKVLSATFKKNIEKHSSIIDKAGNKAAVLTLEYTDSTKSIQIELPDGVIPDGTNPKIEAYANNVVRFKHDETGIYSINLFKTDATKTLTTNATFTDTITITSE